MNIKILLFAGAAFCLLPAAAHAYSHDYKAEKKFLDEAIKGDNSEMMLGHMAAARGNSQGVRDFGKKLEDDHREAKDGAVSVAEKLNIAVTEDIAPEARRERRKLNHLSGVAFDREFVSYMIKDHKMDISKFDKEAKAGHPDTSPLAQDTLPALHKHLEIAERLKSAE